jgi:hypothetical protein
MDEAPTLVQSIRPISLNRSVAGPAVELSMGADRPQPVTCIAFFPLTPLIYLDGTGKLPLLFCCCFESL